MVETPFMARASEARSVRSPSASATFRSARFSRREDGRTSARTFPPRATSARTTCVPTNPVPPVTRSMACEAKSGGQVPGDHPDHVSRVLRQLHDDRRLEARVHQAVLAERIPPRLPVGPVRAVPELLEGRRPGLADQVAGPLPA